jgi:hypothetical protein
MNVSLFFGVKGVVISGSPVERLGVEGAMLVMKA